MMNKIMERGRFEDMGLGKILSYWPAIISLFAFGGWYQTSKANAVLIAEVKTQQMRDEEVIGIHEHRITQVEDAVIYFKDLVQQGRNRNR